MNCAQSLTVPAGRYGSFERLAVDQDVAVLLADRLAGQADHPLDEILDRRVDRFAVGALRRREHDDVAAVHLVQVVRELVDDDAVVRLERRDHRVGRDVERLEQERLHEQRDDERAAMSTTHSIAVFVDDFLRLVRRDDRRVESVRTRDRARRPRTGLGTRSGPGVGLPRLVSSPSRSVGHRIPRRLSGQRRRNTRPTMSFLRMKCDLGKKRESREFDRLSPITQ